MKELFLVMLMLMMLSFSQAYAGTEMRVNLEDLPPDVAAALLQAQKANVKQSDVSQAMQAVKNLDPNNVNQWIDTMAHAVSRLCQTLGVEVNSFIQSPAGMLIAFIMVWKNGGPELVDVVGGLVLSTFVWLVFLPIWIWSFRRCHFKRVIKPFWPWSAVPPTVVEPCYTDSDDRGLSMLLHAAVLLLISGICAMTAFGGW